MPAQANGEAGAARAGTRFPSRYWFPLAAAYAALALPWSVLGQLGQLPAPAGLASEAGHAHEMLFGFALAVVAGYTLTPSRSRQSRALIVVWLIARVAWLGWPGTLAASASNALFAVGLAVTVAPAFMHAEKWRNRSVAAILVALAVAAVIFHAVLLAKIGGAYLPVLLDAVLLLSALMFFMGGRILAPAIAGHIRRTAPRLKHVVQSRIESLVLLALAAAILVSPLPFSGARSLGGALLLLCAALLAVRVLRWRPWLCGDKPDLLALLAGYAWLAIGWVLLARVLLTGGSPVAALHAITVGALGTLTWNVMLRTSLFRARRSTDALPWARAIVLVIGAAAILRILTQGTDPRWTLYLAAAFWCASYTALFVLLQHARQKARPSEGRPHA